MCATKMLRALLLMVCPLLLAISCTEDPAVEQRALADRYLAIWNGSALDDADKILHHDFELRMSPDFEAEKGIDAFKQTIQYWRTGYPDFHIKIDEAVHADGALFVRWTITATNTGEGKYPPTGKKVNVIGLSIVHFAEGKIRDEWIAANNLAWMGQLGFTLQPPQADSTVAGK
jgi:predicted ester cyclase